MRGLGGGVGFNTRQEEDRMGKPMGITTNNEHVIFFWGLGKCFRIQKMIQQQ